MFADNVRGELQVEASRGDVEHSSRVTPVPRRVFWLQRIEYRKIGQLFYAGLAFTLMSTAIYSLTIFEPEVTSAVVGLITICMCWLYADLKHMSSGAD